MKKAPTTSESIGANGKKVLFPPSTQFCPKRPKHGTLADKAVAMFMDGLSIDHTEFADETNSWRLAAIVYNLRSLGWPVKSIHQRCPTKERPKRVVTSYCLLPNFIAKVSAPNGVVK